MSLITPIDWLLCLSSPPLAGVIFGCSTVTAGPLERWAGDPLAEWHMRRRRRTRCQIMPQGLQPHTKGALSLAELLAFFRSVSLSSPPPPLFFLASPFSSGWPSFTPWLIFHLSVRSHVRLSVWTFLRDIWGGHKAEEVPGDALGLALISEATRMCLCLCFPSVDCPLLRLLSQGWLPLLTRARLWPQNDCGTTLHVQSENKSFGAARRETWGFKHLRVLSLFHCDVC